MEVEGDGDFSVMANMIENVLFYVHHLEKSECCNYVCRWSRSNLEKLFVYNPVYDGEGESANRLDLEWQVVFYAHSEWDNNIHTVKISYM